eukprot:PhF_6_TR10808/c0_g1_i1/m.17411/K16296/SCPL-I; serine carboxypeptidase-like clade I
MSSLFHHLCVFSSVLIAIALGAPMQDLVTSLPSYPHPLPSRHFSGYLSGNNQSYLHYYFVEASRVAPATAPVILWMNGGPGCSSMEGFGYEMGPFTFAQYGSNATQPFTVNEHTWTTFANMIFLESPAGVGFSWNAAGNYTTSDTATAQNAFAALTNFFTAKFPEFRHNKFFISGESYAGIYVPTLAEQLLNNPTVIPNFVGIMVGNGVTDWSYDGFATSTLPFMAGHGLLSPELAAAATSACVTNYSKKACDNIQNTIGGIVANVNVYGIYLTCWANPMGTDKPYAHLFPGLSVMVEGARKAMKSSSPVPPGPTNAEPPCADDWYMRHYLNRPDVKQAIHVAPSLTWSLCYEINYVSDVSSVIPIYKRLSQSGKRVLVYNGNTDMAVPYPGTLAWMDTLGLPLVNAWAPWMAQHSVAKGQQVGGFVRQYSGNVTFVSVQGAGHMVPQTRRAAAYEMAFNFVNGLPI